MPSLCHHARTRSSSTRHCSSTSSWYVWTSRTVRAASSPPCWTNSSEGAGRVRLVGLWPCDRRSKLLISIFLLTVFSPVRSFPPCASPYLGLQRAIQRAQRAAGTCDAVLCPPAVRRAPDSTDVRCSRLSSPPVLAAHRRAVSSELRVHRRPPHTGLACVVVRGAQVCKYYAGPAAARAKRHHPLRTRPAAGRRWLHRRAPPSPSPCSHRHPKPSPSPSAKWILTK